jgi:phosphoglycolate phosphatase-like HAD superfamily hydrolase
VKLLLFDVDMTLISTGGAGMRALDHAFRNLIELDNAMDGISPSGKTDPSIIREILIKKVGHDAAMETLLDGLLQAYLSFLPEEVRRSDVYQVLPGIVETLDELTARNDTIIGLATGNVEAGARIKLERGRLNHYFSFGGFGCDSENRTDLVRRAAERAAAKYGASLDPREVFVIGDTPLDVDAGQRAGFQTIGVATGGFTVDDLRQAGANEVLSNFNQDRSHFFQSIFS